MSNKGSQLLRELQKRIIPTLYQSAMSLVVSEDRIVLRGSLGWDGMVAANPKAVDEYEQKCFLHGCRRGRDSFVFLVHSPWGAN